MQTFPIDATPEAAPEAAEPMPGANRAATFDVIVVGAGHAGCEAALAAARMGRRTLLLTMNLDSVALMPCNPSIGGPAKGHLVREIDALGGEMGRNTDRTFLQIRLLNTGKGPAVQALRAQCDKQAYRLSMKFTLESQPNLHLKQATVSRLLFDQTPGSRAVMRGVTTSNGATFLAPAIILTTGTFGNGKLIVGDGTQAGGRAGEGASLGISNELARIGIAVRRFKTGTPPRIDARTIDFSRTTIQPGSPTPLYFSLDASSREEIALPPGPPNRVYPVPTEAETAWRRQLPCYLVHTTPTAHAIIRANLHRSPLFNGIIEGIGPRYCPSIEDKVVRFADKDQHQVFLEPEGWHTSEVYVQGMNTSLPEDVQLDVLRSIPALERVELVRTGYAVEYDCVPSHQLTPSLEAKAAAGLFLAGQINGTSGYEEAAAQGLMAGINAALSARGDAPFILGRNEAYIGVLIDDLVTQAPTEPYRLHTSSAEHRLLLRHDNADLRLTARGHQLGLVGDTRQRAVEQRRALADHAERALYTTTVTPSREVARRAEEVGLEAITQNATAAQLLCRAGATYRQVRQIGSACEMALPELDEATAGEVEQRVKYAGYVRKAQQGVARLRRLEATSIPPDFTYHGLGGLRTEARQNLSRIQPRTIAQALRIPGVTVADASVLLLHLERARRTHRTDGAAEPLVDGAALLDDVAP
jgi:tRNA uridine 5-carboxymethylaminomethyl modification enzyme